ncbi:inositol monophosphatase family protein [Marinigracilibium pacificum]|uniref:Inositol-1-monophosphatase n=1 Tax=Marinigracilibium pacificum TaxID=2729599 RepID=A0A848IUB7_9BACT|nr:inositol monophosphatase family protein [Marinigracilibium pacificum]NMM46788.1 inositol monophosphatase [Marinigracilibium pacificum]
MNLNKDFFQECRNIIHDVGQFILNESKSFDFDNVEKKGFNDLVSYVDKQAEKQLVDRLMALLPEAGMIAEEGTLDKKGEKYNWIIDPLDGTTNFTHGLPVFAVSVALMEDNELIAGFIYEPNRDEFFHAVKGQGAFMNESPISVSKIPTLSDSLVATGFPYYDFGKINDYVKILMTFMQKSHGVRRMGSAAIDLAYVSCGRFEGFFEYNLQPWDVAAGALIVKEAGGNVTDFSGGENFVFGKEILAGNSAHPEMLDTIRNYW